jgi:NAD(P)-dependent dehydrogenase (short-subunit alcohol dehydrogenase family)
MNLAGRTVLVTGAARGIGAEVARQAAARGARLALVGLEPELLSDVARSLPGTGHTWHQADVTDQSALDAAARSTVDQTGGIDVVVANAGVANLGTINGGDVEALVRTIDVNLIGAVRTVGATIPHVRARHGYFLLVSSAAAFTALPGMAAYAASKAGVEQFGNVLRLELAGVGIGVGTAHPIWIDTDMVRDIQLDLPSFRDALRRLPWPLGTTVSVQRCAQAMVRGIERRRRRVYVPRTIGGVQAMRSMFTSAPVEAVLRRYAASAVPQMEAEVAALGRSFGQNSAGRAAAAVRNEEAS